MNDGSSAFLVGGFEVIAAGGIALGIQRIIAPRSTTKKNALFFARVWFSWAIFVIVLVTLPEVFKSFTVDSIARLLIGCAGYGLPVFALGYSWGKFFAESNDNKNGETQRIEKQHSVIRQTTAEPFKPSQPEAKRLKMQSNQQVPETDAIDEHKIYVIANNQFDEGRPDDGLRIKCMTMSGGDLEKARYLYIAEQVKQLATDSKRSVTTQAFEPMQRQSTNVKVHAPQKSKKVKCYVCANEYGQENAECPVCHSTAKVGELNLENIERITCDLGHFYYCGTKFYDRESARLHVKKLNQLHCND